LFTLRKPKPEAIERFLLAQATLELTYREVGATRTAPPKGYWVDHLRMVIGAGEEDFRRAKSALGRQAQFGRPWLSVARPAGGLVPDRVMSISARVLGIWLTSACRIIYVIDSDTQFGFANGTLPGHVGCGEERFLVEIDEQGTVWYDLFAFSRPRFFPLRLVPTLMRRYQHRFQGESAIAMREAVEQGSAAV